MLRSVQDVSVNFKVVESRSKVWEMVLVPQLFIWQLNLAIFKL